MPAHALRVVDLIAFENLLALSDSDKKDFCGVTAELHFPFPPAIGKPHSAPAVEPIGDTRNLDTDSQPPHNSDLAGLVCAVSNLD